MYKHLQLRFLQNVEDATGIVFSNEAMQGHGMTQKQDTKRSKLNHKEVQQCGWLTKGA